VMPKPRIGQKGAEVNILRNWRKSNRKGRGEGGSQIVNTHHDLECQKRGKDVQGPEGKKESSRSDILIWKNKLP